MARTQYPRLWPALLPYTLNPMSPIPAHQHQQPSLTRPTVTQKHTLQSARCFHVNELIGSSCQPLVRLFGRDSRPVKPFTASATLLASTVRVCIGPLQSECAQTGRIHGGL